MRICLVSDGLPPYCGGAPLYTFRHAQRLQTAEGIKTILIAWDRSENRSAHDILPAYVHPVKLHFQEVGGTQTPASLVKFLLHLSELGMRLGWLLFRMRHEFDILHVVNAAPWFNLVSIPLAKALNKPVILEMVALGGDDPLKLNERGRLPEQQVFPHRPLKYSLFLKADAYVSISPALSEACRQAGLPDARLFQIPWGVDAEKFKPLTPQEKRALRHKLGLDEEQIIILFVGRIDKDKGVHHLLAAFRQVVPYHPKAQLLVVGPNLPPDPAYLQAVYQNIAAWGLSEKVILVDVEKMVDNVQEYMQASDIFCLPTRREGLGLVIIEAMATGLPVVVSRLEGVTTDIIRSDREGVLIPVGDTTKLADAITELISDTALRARLGQAARQRVLREFTLETYYRRCLSLYKRFINEAPAHD